MISFKLFFATEARANLFKILKLVEKGEDIFIIKKDNNKKFKISLVEEESTGDKVKLLKSAPGIGMGNKTPEEIKAILQTRLNQ